MTFKVKGGIQIGANVAVDANALFQQIELNPSVRPTINFDFVNSKTVDARVTFARSSQATFVDEDGWIKTAAINVPRIEYSANGSGQPRGLSLEFTSSNIISSSGNFFGSTWTPANVTVAPNVGIAPDGTYTATKVYDSSDASATFHWLTGSNITVVSGTTYTFSIFVKSAELTRIGVYPLSGGNGSVFDLSSVTVAFNDTGVTGSIERFKDGWFRLSTTIASSVTTASPRFYLMNPTTSYTGDGTRGIFVWGAQFEATTSTTPTSFIYSNTSFTSRGSNGTFVDNADGLVKYATSNVVRYHFNPYTRSNTEILVEPASTNLMTLSESLGSWGVTGATATNNSNTAPTGTQVATTIVEDTNNSRHYVGATAVGSVVANTFVTGSIFLKAGTRTRAYVWVGIPGSPFTRAGCVVDLSTGNAVVSNVGSPLYSFFNVENCGSGWYRVAVTGRIDTTSTTMYMEVGGADNTNNTTYLGNGSRFFAWGAQIENTRFATSYIPATGASTVTRAADVYSTATVTRGSDTFTMPATDPNIFTPSEGTVVCESETCGDITNNQYVWGLGNGTTDSLISMRNLSSVLQFVVYTNGFTQGSANFTTSYVANTVGKAAVTYSNTSWITAYNGTIVEQIGPGIIPPYNTLTLRGGFASGVRKTYIRNFTYYPVKLSNTELRTITTS